VGLNVAIFVVVLILRSQNEELFESLYNALALQPDDPRPWQFVTYAFLHSLQDFWHIAGNMFFLWVFGPPIEDRLGRWKYLAFYLAAGAASGGLHALLTSTPQVGLIGASGAISGVAGAFFVLFPRTNVRVFVFFFLIGVFSIPAVWFIGFYIAWNIFVTASGSAGNVATVAHLAGYAFGAAVAGLGLATGWLPREPYDLFSMGQRRARRQQFKSAARLRERDTRKQNTRKQKETRDGQDERAPEENDALARLRGRLVTLIGARDFAAAADAYRSLLDFEPDTPGAAVLAARQQLELANALYRAGQLDLAAAAYERFLGAYPGDPDAPSVSLMLGLISARHLNDPVRARSLISQARSKLRHDHEQHLADQLLAELG